MARVKKTHCKHGHLRSPDNVDRHGHCRACSRKRSYEWRENNLERHRASISKWRKDNPTRTRAIDIANYSGLDVETIYQYLLERGDISVCDICQQECPTGKSLAFDHDHETGEIRGLLCNKCNRGLGMFNDSVKLMEIATEYLKGAKHGN